MKLFSGGKMGGRDCCSGIRELLVPGFFKALGDPNRLDILARLAEAGEPQKVSQVAGCCVIDLSVVSRHLAVLRDAGILDCQKKGKEVFYAVRASALAGTLRRLADAIEACCPPPSDTPERGAEP